MTYVRPKTGKGLFSCQEYQYDPEHDCYLCPAGQVLRHTIIISGGAYKTLEYAKQRKRRGLLHITSLGELGILLKT